MGESKATETSNKIKVEIKCPFNLANSDNSFSSARDKR